MRWIMIMVLLAGCASVRVEEENEQLKARVAKLEKELKEVRFWLDQYRGGENKIPGPTVGKVLDVKGALVALSFGNNDGVRVGDTYNLRRGGTYVGRVRVTKTLDQQSVGEFDSQYRGRGAPPRAGDIAYPAR